MNGVMQARTSEDANNVLRVTNGDLDQIGIVSSVDLHVKQQWGMLF